jgi:hypothetical protein
MCDNSCDVRLVAARPRTASDLVAAGHAFERVRARSRRRESALRTVRRGDVPDARSVALFGLRLQDRLLRMVTLQTPAGGTRRAAHGWSLRADRRMRRWQGAFTVRG